MSILADMGFGTQVQTKTIAERLGYPADAKLVILHADDVAMAHCSAETPYTTHDDTNGCDYSGTACTTGNDFNSTDGELMEFQTPVAAGTQTATIGTSITTSAFTGGMVAL